MSLSEFAYIIAPSSGDLFQRDEILPGTRNTSSHQSFLSVGESLKTFCSVIYICQRVTLFRAVDVTSKQINKQLKIKLRVLGNRVESKL